MQKLTNSITWFRCNRQKKRNFQSLWNKTTWPHEMQAYKQALCAERMSQLTLSAGADCRSLCIVQKGDVKYSLCKGYSVPLDPKNTVIIILTSILLFVLLLLRDCILPRSLFFSEKLYHNQHFSTLYNEFNKSTPIQVNRQRRYFELYVAADPCEREIIV